MSLGRVSYLESWEHHPPPFIRRPSFGDVTASGDEESINRHSRTQSPDPRFSPSSLPSSFPSRAVRHKLSFNPVAGRGWAHSSATEPDEEQRPLFRPDVSPDLTIQDAGPARLAEDGIAAEDVFQDPKWDTAETTPAFEVNRGKRICRLYVLRVMAYVGTNYKFSPGDSGRYLLFACCWSSVWIRSYQTGIYTRGCVPESMHQ